MSDIEFFLAFICPGIALGLILLFRRNEPLKAILGGILIVSVASMAAAAPFAHYLAGRGLVIFSPNRSFALWGTVPLEIYFSLFAKAFLAGLVLYFFRPRIHPKSVASRPLLIIGAMGFALVVAVGLIMLDNIVTVHLGSVLVWGGGILFAQWLLGSSLVWRTRGAFSAAALLSGAYFCLVEAIAIRTGLWDVDHVRLLGIYLGNLPLERAVYQMLFSLAVCQGLEIVWRKGRKTEELSAQNY